MEKKFFTPPDATGGAPNEENLEAKEQAALEESFLRGPKISKPIAKRIKALEAEGAEALAQEPLPEAEDAIKHEAYALGALLIKNFHQKVQERLKSDPEIIVKKLAQFESLNTLPEPLFSLDDQRAIQVNQEALKALPTPALHLALQRKFFPELYTSLFQEEMMSSKKNFTEEETAQYNRLRTILFQKKFRAYSAKGKFMGQSVETFLSRGAGTASFEAWNILLGATALYNERFGQELTPETFRQMVPELEEILVKLSSMNIDDFTMLHQGGHKTTGHLLGKMWRQAILVEGTPEEPTVRLDPSFMAFCQLFFEEEPERREWQQGCPARDVRVETADGKKVSVISEVLALYQDLAEKIFLPSQKRLLEFEEEREKKSL